MRLTIASALLAVTAACGDDSPTLDDICNQEDGVFPLLFSKLFTCFPELGYFVGEVPSMAEMHAACDGSLQPYLDDGTVKINGAADFAACREYIETLDCNALADADTTPCDDLLVGTLELNAECSGNDQCVGDAFCDKAAGSDCGVCRGEKALSAACEEDFECLSGFCHPDENVCAEQAEEGEACTSKSDCGGTRVCSPSSSTCVDEPTWAEGTPCRDFIDCDLTESGLYCDTNMMQCRRFLALGDTCSLTTPLCNFIRYEHCAQDGAAFRCVAPTTVSTEGGECNFFEGTQCASGMRCLDHDEAESTPAICVTPGVVGDACNETDMPCELFLECVADRCQYGGHSEECTTP